MGFKVGIIIVGLLIALPLWSMAGKKEIYNLKCSENNKDDTLVCLVEELGRSDMSY